MSDSKKKIYLGEDLVCQTFTDAEEQAKAFDLFGLEQPVVSSNAPASTRPVQQGQVCEFDGVDDHINCGNSTSFDFPDLINIQFYLKLNGTGLQNFISKGVGTTNNYSVDYSNGLRFFGYDSGTAVGSLSGYTLSTGQWYHIQCIKDATHFRIFVDGIEVRTVASTATLTTNSNSLLIGKRETRQCDGYMSGVIIGDVAQYNLNHASGTTAYDSSGNGNDGSLQNGAAFVVDNTLPPEADRLNLDGYTDDSGVLKPRDESDPTNDIDGNPLQYSGSVYPRRPEYRNSYAASFDGVDDYISLHGTGAVISSTMSFGGMFKLSASLVGLVSKGLNNQWGLFIASPSLLTLRVIAGTDVSYTIPAELRTGLQHVYAVVDGTSGYLYINGVEVANGTVNAMPAATSDLVQVGKLGSVYPFNGDASNVRVYESALSASDVLSLSRSEDITPQPVIHLPITEGAGDTAHDISGNGNHGTINNASTGTEGAGFWAGRIDGEANALNNNNGFSKRMLFDGVDDAVLLDAFNFDGSVFGFAFKYLAGESQLMQIQDNSNSAHLLSITINNSSKDVIVRLADIATNTTQSSFDTTGLDEGSVYSIIVSFGAGGNTISSATVNGSPMSSGNRSGRTQSSGVAADSFYLGRRQDGNFPYSGTVYNVFVLGVHQWSGYGNTDADWIDQVGSNDGTVNGSPALLRIPADTSDPTKDALGDTLTNPAITDGYNGAETELDAYNIAEGENPSPATNNNPDLDAIEFGTDFAANDAAFMRLKSSTENDRLITFEDDLTGGDETLAQKYTQ